jgi:acyl carrier protein
MTIGCLTSSQPIPAPREIFTTNDVRTLIAKHLGVDLKLVTDEAHLTYDLGADWLDRLELMIAIEDEFAGVEIADDDVEHIDVVGDLIRHIENASSEKRRRLVGESLLQ